MYMDSLEVPFTQNLLLDDSNHDISTQKYGVWKSRNLGSLSESERRLSKAMCLCDLNPYGFGSLNLAQNES